MYDYILARYNPNTETMAPSLVISSTCFIDAFNEAYLQSGELEVIDPDHVVDIDNKAECIGVLSTKQKCIYETFKGASYHETAKAYYK